MEESSGGDKERRRGAGQWCCWSCERSSGWSGGRSWRWRFRRCRCVSTMTKIKTASASTERTTITGRVSQDSPNTWRRSWIISGGPYSKVSPAEIAEWRLFRTALWRGKETARGRGKTWRSRADRAVEQLGSFPKGSAGHPANERVTSRNRHEHGGDEVMPRLVR